MNDEVDVLGGASDVVADHARVAVRVAHQNVVDRQRLAAVAHAQAGVVDGDRHAVDLPGDVRERPAVDEALEGDRRVLDDAEFRLAAALDARRHENIDDATEHLLADVVPRHALVHSAVALLGRGDRQRPSAVLHRAGRVLPEGHAILEPGDGRRRVAVSVARKTDRSAQHHREVVGVFAPASGSDPGWNLRTRRTDQSK